VTHMGQTDLLLGLPSKTDTMECWAAYCLLDQEGGDTGTGSQIALKRLP